MKTQTEFASFEEEDAYYQEISRLEYAEKAAVALRAPAILGANSSRLLQALTDAISQDDQIDEQARDFLRTVFDGKFPELACWLANSHHAQEADFSDDLRRSRSVRS